MLIKNDTDLKDLRNVKISDFKRGEATRIKLPYKVLGIDINEFCADGFDPGKLQMRIAEIDHNPCYEGWARGENILYANQGKYCFALGDNDFDFSFLVFDQGTWFWGYPFDLGHVNGREIPEEKITNIKLLQRSSNEIKNWHPEVSRRLSGFNDAAYKFALFIDWNLSNETEEVISFPAERVMPSLFYCPLNSQETRKRDGFRNVYNSTASILGLVPHKNPKTRETQYYYLPDNYNPSTIRREFLNPNYIREKRKKKQF